MLKTWSTFTVISACHNISQRTLICRLDSFPINKMCAKIQNPVIWCQNIFLCRLHGPECRSSKLCIYGKGIHIFSVKKESPIMSQIWKVINIKMTYECHQAPRSTGSVFGWLTFFGEVTKRGVFQWQVEKSGLSVLIFFSFYNTSLCLGYKSSPICET